MPKFRTKPVVIEAIQYDGSNAEDISAWAARPDGNALIEEFPIGHGLVIKTMEGNMQAIHGDWIIRGVKGEFYPCKPDIFKATYEPAE